MAVSRPIWQKFIVLQKCCLNYFISFLNGTSIVFKTFKSSTIYFFINQETILLPNRSCHNYNWITILLQIIRCNVFLFLIQSTISSDN